MTDPPEKPLRGSARQMAKVRECEAKCDRLDRERKAALSEAFRERGEKGVIAAELRALREERAKNTVRVRVAAQVFPAETHAEAEARRARIAALGIVCGVEFA